MVNKEQLKEVPPRVSIIGVPISAVNMDTCIEFLFQNWEAAHGNYICVSNVFTTVTAYDNPQYHQVQTNSLLSVPDGKPLSIVGKRQYVQMRQVTGPHLMLRMFEEAKKKSIRFFFYGTTDEILKNMLVKLKAQYPWIEIAGCESSVFRPMSAQEEDALVARINETHPDIVWVAIGAPRQEELCSRLEGKVSGLMIGVGGAFAVLAGVYKPAPEWVQKLCLEWLFRYIQDPKKHFSKAFLFSGRFVLLCAKERLQRKKK